MDRPIDISINVEPGTSYILTDSQGEFDPSAANQYQGWGPYPNAMPISR